MDLNNYYSKPFQEGQKAWNNYHNSLWKLNIENPYKENTQNWYLWNRGWNNNLKGIK